MRDYSEGEENLLRAFRESTQVSTKLSFPLLADDYPVPDDIPRTGFLHLYAIGEFTYTQSFHIPTDPKKLITLNMLLARVPNAKIIRHEGRQGAEKHIFSVLMRHGLDFIYISCGDRYMRAFFGSDSREEAIRLNELFRMHFWFVEHKPEQTMFNISSMEPEDCSSEEFPDIKWDSIKNNYPEDSAVALEALIKRKTAPSLASGRIILLHGPPGTGKTFFLRSLLTEWKKWARGVVVVDPEELLRSSKYFLGAIRRGPHNLTKALIFEDAEQAITSTGHSRSSALSKLLNLSDGIIGSSNPPLIIASTNLPLNAIDPALLRPGRCLANLEFGPFNLSETNRRLGDVATSTKGLTLAEIYERLGEVEQVNHKARKNQVGFAIDQN